MLFVENTVISQNPMNVPMIYVLITYSRQHDILIPTYIGMSSLYQVLNSLTAIDAHERQLFNELRSTIVSRRIFIRSQSLMAR